MSANSEVEYDSLSDVQGSDVSINSGFSISLSVPGKVILHGEHSVVYGKLALAASLELRTKLLFEEHELSEISGNFVNINLHAVNLVHCYSVNDIQNHLLDQSVPLIKNCSNFNFEKPELINHEILLQRIETFTKSNCGTVPLSGSQRQALTSLFYLFAAIVGPLGLPLRPFTLTVTTDLVIGAGLGSSASFLVAVSALLVRYAKSKSNKLEYVENPHVLDKKELELISKWAFNGEKIMHGKPSGLDNTICTFGNMVEFRKGTLPKTMALSTKIKVLLINTKVPRVTKVLVERVRLLWQKYPMIVDNIMEAMDGVTIAALQNLIKLNETTSSDKIKLDACQKIVLEIYKELGMLSNLNQNLLRSLGVSHTTLDRICAILAEDGLCGKLTGAGGGGYAIAIIPPNFNSMDLENVISRLEMDGFKGVIVELGGPGVVIDKS